jgi:hypothetical protein
MSIICFRSAFSTAHTLSAFVLPNGRNLYRVFKTWRMLQQAVWVLLTFIRSQILTDSSTSSSIRRMQTAGIALPTTPSAISTLFAIDLADTDDSRSYSDGTSGIY